MRYLYFFAFFTLFIACQTSQKKRIKGNPPSEGFDLTNSDAKAIAIADEVIEAMGGASKL